MKNLINLSIVLLMNILFAACDENDIMPEYEKKGTATSTVATISASNTTPLAGQSVTVTIKYVNPSTDPVSTIVLRAKVGSGSYADLQSFDEQSAAQGAEITREVNYVTPATPGTVTFEMVISSQKEYPQIRRTSITVK